MLLKMWLPRDFLSVDVVGRSGSEAGNPSTVVCGDKRKECDVFPQIYKMLNSLERNYIVTFMQRTSQSQNIVTAEIR